MDPETDNWNASDETEDRDPAPGSFSNLWHPSAAELRRERRRAGYADAVAEVRRLVAKGHAAVVARSVGDPDLGLHPNRITQVAVPEAPPRGIVVQPIFTLQKTRPDGSVKTRVVHSASWPSRDDPRSANGIIDAAGAPCSVALPHVWYLLKQVRSGMAGGAVDQTDAYLESVPLSLEDGFSAGLLSARVPGTRTFLVYLSASFRLRRILPPVRRRHVSR